MCPTVWYVKKYWKPKMAIFIDARDEEDYKLGHIQNAINIPFDYYEDFEYQLDDVDLEKILIIYCSGGECSLSIDLADYLIQERGFFNVLISSSVSATSIVFNMGFEFPDIFLLP